MPERHDADLPDSEANVDHHVLDLLLDHGNQRPWSIEEVIRAYGHEQQALDGLERLHAFGLIHRMDRFVFPTRAALRLIQLRDHG